MLPAIKAKPKKQKQYEGKRACAASERARAPCSVRSTVRSPSTGCGQEQKKKHSSPPLSDGSAAISVSAFGCFARLLLDHEARGGGGGMDRGRGRQ